MFSLGTEFSLSCMLAGLLFDTATQESYLSYLESPLHSASNEMKPAVFYAQTGYWYAVQTASKAILSKWKSAKSVTRIGNGLKNNFEKFSNATSFDGFHELYNAQKKRCKVFWLVIISAAFAVTTFQVYRAGQQYVNQPSTTKIQPASKDEILYPKVKLCFTHWIYWIDWKKAFALNFTKSTVLYGMSFINDIYSSEYFDMPHTKTAFERQMGANNFTRVSDFYIAVARKFPIVDITDEGLDKSLNYFDEIDIVHKLDTYTVLCYGTNVEVMKKSFLKFVHSSYVFAFGIGDPSYSSFSEYITKEEYNHYIPHWLECHTNFVIKPEMYSTDWRNYSLPLILYTDPFSEDPTLIEYENDRYKINFDVSAHRWKSRPCRKNAREMITNRTEFHLCLAEYQLKACKCPDLALLVLLKKDYPYIVCSNPITFLNRNQSEPLNVPASNYTRCEFGADQVANLEYRACKDKYICPCEVWSYTCSATVTKFNSLIHQMLSKRTTEIFLIFPLGDQTLIMTETDSQTWEDFVGNVGGLLGIWTGASVLSFVQLFYICCYNDGTSLQKKKFVKKGTISKWRRRRKVVDKKRRLSC